MNRKNVVVITSMQGQVDTSCEEYCVNTWKYWCDKHDVDLIILNQPITDVNYMKPTWQRWYIWNILENSDLHYDKVLLVDVDTMIHWNSPNIFDEITTEIGVCSDNDNISVAYVNKWKGRFFNNVCESNDIFVVKRIWDK